MDVTLTSGKASQARRSLGISQAQVCRDLEMNRSYLSQFENGKYLLPESEQISLRDYYEEKGFEFSAVEEPKSGPPQAVSTFVEVEPIVRDGIQIPAHLDDFEIENLFAQYESVNRRIDRLAGSSLKKPEPENFLNKMFDDGERFNPAEVNLRVQELVSLMAEGYALLRSIHGDISFDLQAREEPETALDFVILHLDEHNAIDEAA